MPTITILTNTGYEITIGTETGTQQTLDQIAENLRSEFSSSSKISSLIAGVNEGTALLSASVEFLMHLVGVGASLIACIFVLGTLVLIPVGAYHLYGEYKKPVEREKKKVGTEGEGEKTA